MNEGPLELDIPRIRFVREQTGEVEDDFKKRVIHYFVESRIRCKAYLVQAFYNDPSGVNVVLCIRLTVGDADEVESQIGQIFAAIFSGYEHLDTLFLTEQTEGRVACIAVPFFNNTEQI